MDIKNEPDDELLSSESTCQDGDNHQQCVMNEGLLSASGTVKLEVFSEDDHHKATEDDFIIDSKNIKQENEEEEEEFLRPNRVVKVTYNASPLKVEQLELGVSSNANWTQDQEFFLEPIATKHSEEEEVSASKDLGDELNYDAIPIKVERLELGECSNAQYTVDQIPSGQKPSHLLGPLLHPSQNISSSSLGSIGVEEIDVKDEIFNYQRIVVVINLERRVFHERNFVCGVCMHLFGSLLSLQVHKKSNLCVDTSVNLTLSGETMQLPSQNTVFECDSCNFTSEWQSVLRNHKLSHSSERPFKCDQCSFASGRKYQLDVHKCIHSGEKPLKCHLCDFKTAWQSAMRIHRLLHTGEKPFKCDQCNFTSAQKCHLKDHKWRHTSEKPFKCADCGFSTAYQSVLKRHKLSHSGEKVLKCNQCSLTFGQLSVLKQHQLSHSGEKPFKCGDCGFTSAWKTALQNHQLLHTGEKPFKCEKCSFKSARQSALKRHILTHSSKRALKRDQLVKIKIDRTQ